MSRTNLRAALPHLTAACVLATVVASSVAHTPTHLARFAELGMPGFFFNAGDSPSAAPAVLLAILPAATAALGYFLLRLAAGLTGFKPSTALADACRAVALTLAVAYAAALAGGVLGVGIFADLAVTAVVGPLALVPVTQISLYFLALGVATGIATAAPRDEAFAC